MDPTTHDGGGPPVDVLRGVEEGYPLLSDDPLWYKEAIIYELHVRSFHDSADDGIGDFRGLTRKLDYLQELGVTALWLLPFYPSPLRDDGYDIADYTSVNPDYGTLDDFQHFLDEAHRRGLRVITELVINHTSDQHPWFQRARRAPRGSPEREFYVWSDDPQRYHETRIIFQDFEPSNWTWDPVAEQYFWHRFYHHQPDLNFDNPLVHDELFRALDFWLERGVDGLRLDAIPYLYEREGTNCENLPETHVFLKKLRAHVDRRYRNRMLLAEANQWPEDAAEYFGDGDECHMNFHFPIMPRLYMAVRMEDRFPITDILEQTPEIPEACQWATFLRNHDELTLEMVTDEERDYMYRAYAHDSTARINLGIRRRLAPLLENDRRRIELMNSLLFSLTGTPVLYYGDEIGMGDNFYLGDRHGVRTPMQWSGDRNAGFSRANPQRLFLPVIIDPEYQYEAVNVEAQQRNPSSLLWWMRRLIALRKHHPAFGRGTLEWLDPENKRILAFVREDEDETILVVANLSRFSQALELDLSRWSGRILTELFGRTAFPAAGPEPYRLTLGPHAFHWFLLETEEERSARLQGRGGVAQGPALPLMEVEGDWGEMFSDARRDDLERALLSWLRERRWFGGKGREIRSGEIVDRFSLPSYEGNASVALFRVEYVGEEAETYVLPLALTPVVEDRLPAELPDAVARVNTDGTPHVVHDALVLPEFCHALLRHLASGESALTGGGGASGGGGSATGGPELVGAPGRPAEEILAGIDRGELEPHVGRAEQTNTSVIYGHRWILKLFRRIEPGVSLDAELGELLTEEGFEHTPGTAGTLDLRHGADPRPGQGGVHTVAVLQEFVPNQGNAFDYSVDALERYFEEALASDQDPEDLLQPSEWEEEGIPEGVRELVGGAFLEMIQLLGVRSGELHRALASRAEDPRYAPEPFSTLYQRSLYQSMRNLTGRALRIIHRERRGLSGDVQVGADAVLARRDQLLARFRRVLDGKLGGARIRVHGDYHLGQVLFTGKDFVIIDFEGEPARPLTERRLKRSPLRDVAGMLRSFHYAAYMRYFEVVERGLTAPEDRFILESWARLWYEWCAHAFLSGYLEAVEGTDLLPGDPAERRLLLDFFLLEKALYEVGYELENRPDWGRIPLEGILQLLAERAEGESEREGEPEPEEESEREGESEREEEPEHEGPAAPGAG